MDITHWKPALILLIGGALGLLADRLLWGTQWGLGFTLWVGALTASCAFLFARSPGKVTRGWKAGLAILLLTGLAVAWRDSEALRVFDVLAAMGCTAVVLMHSASGNLATIRMSDLGREGLAQVIDAILGAPSLVAADREAWAKGRAAAVTLPIVRGVILTIPLLVVFSALYASADPTFEHILVTILNIDLFALLRHGLFIAVVTWILTGVFYGRFQNSHAAPLRTAISGGPSLGVVEVSLPIGAVALVSGLFVLTQVAYLFGGATYVLGTPAMTVAEYARRGFFELIVAAALTLPLLLLSEWLLRNESRRRRRVFIVLATVQLVLLAVIMGSAWHRLIVYQQNFGLTESRLYAAAFLVWVAAVCGLFAATVLRGRREYFLSFALLGGFLVLAGLHLLNPDAHIARVNLARHRDGAGLDTCYIGHLSADAVPVLVEGLKDLQEPERSALLRALSRQAKELDREDWRSWNLSTQEARRLLPLTALESGSGVWKPLPPRLMLSSSTSTLR